MGELDRSVMEILTPLTYCGRRMSGETVCDNFASTTIQGMAFCEGCAAYIESEIDKQEVQFVPVSVSMQSELRLRNTRKKEMPGSLED